MYKSYLIRNFFILLDILFFMLGVHVPMVEFLSFWNGVVVNVADISWVNRDNWWIRL